MDLEYSILKNFVGFISGVGGGVVFSYGGNKIDSKFYGPLVNEPIKRLNSSAVATVFLGTYAFYINEPFMIESLPGILLGIYSGATLGNYLSRTKNV
jgi:hypothetical protein